MSEARSLIFLVLILFVIEHAVFRSFDIVIMTASDGPEKEEPGDKTQDERQEYQEPKCPHDRSSGCSKALISVHLRAVVRSTCLRNVDDLVEHNGPVVQRSGDLNLPPSRSRKLYDNGKEPVAHFLR